MNKDRVNKSSDIKKCFIRHAVQAKPKTVIIHEPELSHSEVESDKKLCIEQDGCNNVELLNTKLNYPELNSVFQLVQKIDSVENMKPKKIKSLTDLSKNHPIVVDKISKHLNFPYNQAIYKGLIPLCVKKECVQPVSVSSKEYVIHKDKEPILSDFYTPKRLPEYCFQVKQIPDSKTVTKQFDGLKLYRTMKNWS